MNPGLSDSKFSLTFLYTSPNYFYLNCSCRIHLFFFHFVLNCDTAYISDIQKKGTSSPCMLLCSPWRWPLSLLLWLLSPCFSFLNHVYEHSQTTGFFFSFELYMKEIILFISFYILFLLCNTMFVTFILVVICNQVCSFLFLYSISLSE